MRYQTVRVHPAIAVAIAVATLTACAEEPPEFSYAPPPASVRERLGAVAVVPVSCDDAYAIPTPAQGGGAGASAGAGQGALGGAAPGAYFCYYLGGPSGIGCLFPGIPMMAAGALLGAIGGTVVGAAKAHSAEEVTAAESVLRQIMASTPADDLLADLIVAKAGETGISARVERADRGAETGELTKQGFSSSLTINVETFSLVGSGEIEPSVTLMIGVLAKIDTVEEADAWSRRWLYRTADQSFFDLAANDGSRLRADISAGLAAIATKVTTDVFVSESPQSYPDPTRVRDLPPGVVRPVSSCSLKT